MVNTSETKNEKLKNNEATVQVMKNRKPLLNKLKLLKKRVLL